MTLCRAALAAWMAAAALAPAALATEKPIPRSALVQRLGMAVPMEATFRDESGRVVTLGDYFGRRPVVLSFAYFGCSQLCSEVLAGLDAGLSGLDAHAPAPEVVTISIDPDDTPAQAAFRRGRVKGPAARRWHFLVGGKGAIRAVTAACGFRYAYDRPTHQFAHPAGAMVLTPDGKLSHYLYGLSFPSGELDKALGVAAAGRVGPPVTETLLRCFHDVFSSGRYGPWIDALLKALCLATVAGLAGFVGWMAASERRRDRAEGGAR